MTRPPPERERLDRERRRLLVRVEHWLEVPMLVLGLAWLALLVVELTRGLPPLLAHLGTVIWVVFVAEFLLRLALAPRRLRYLKNTWLTAVSLALPALRVFRLARVFRALRVARATRGLRLAKVVGTVNRGMRALGRSMERRGAGYALALTGIVLVAGAAGMVAFERGGLDDYGEALWWTAMLLTTVGSEYWPRTAEGRLLALLLSLYALGILGYLTAALASFFVGRDAADRGGEVAGKATLEALRGEIAALRRELAAHRGPADREP